MKIREINWPIIVIAMVILLFWGLVYFFLSKYGIWGEIRSFFISLSFGKSF